MKKKYRMKKIVQGKKSSTWGFYGYGEVGKKLRTEIWFGGAIDRGKRTYS